MPEKRVTAVFGQHFSKPPKEDVFGAGRTGPLRSDRAELRVAEQPKLEAAREKLPNASSIT